MLILYLYIPLCGGLPEDGHLSLIHLGGEFDIQRTVHRDIFLIIETNKIHYFSTLFWNNGREENVVKQHN